LLYDESTVLDVTPLGELRNFLLLAVRLGMRDLAPLVKLQKLVALDIGLCDVRGGVDCLADMPNLAWIGVSRVRMTRPWKVSPTSRLSSLDVASTECGDLSSLSDAAQLRSLDLSQCENITNLDPIGRMPNLRFLSLRGCKGLMSISGLASARRLARLEVDIGAPPLDLTDVAEITSLTDLTIGGEDLADLSPLSRLSALERLDIVGCIQVQDLRPLVPLKQLKCLILSGCEGITDFTPLGHMKQLVELWLDGTLVKDLSFVNELKDLRELDIAMCWDIEDLSPLVGLRRKGVVVQLANDEFEERLAELEDEALHGK
jgi:internalin A